MTTCTIVDNSVTCPIAYTFSVSSSQPVTFLSKVALSTELITVIEINFSAFLVLKKIPVFRMMAINTAEFIAFLPVIYNHITMG